MDTVNKQDIVDLRKIDNLTIDKIKQDIHALCGDCVMLDIRDLDEHRKFLIELQDKTGIPRPVLEYYLFGISCSYS